MWNVSGSSLKVICHLSIWVNPGLRLPPHPPAPAPTPPPGQLWNMRTELWASHRVFTGSVSRASPPQYYLSLNLLWHQMPLVTHTFSLLRGYNHIAWGWKVRGPVLLPSRTVFRPNRSSLLNSLTDELDLSASFFGLGSSGESRLLCVYSPLPKQI